jgi:hypothetical protein
LLFSVRIENFRQHKIRRILCHPEQAKRAEGSVPPVSAKKTDSSTPLRSAQNDTVNNNLAPDAHKAKTALLSQGGLELNQEGS